MNISGKYNQSPDFLLECRTQTHLKKPEILVTFAQLPSIIIKTTARYPGMLIIIKTTARYPGMLIIIKTSARYPGMLIIIKTTARYPGMLIIITSPVNSICDHQISN
jgi:hypothetical protein